MYRVGSIDPEGMLNGATMKLRKAQASDDERSGRSAQGPNALLLALPGGRLGSGGVGRAHRRACFPAPCAEVKPGWHLRGRVIMWHGANGRQRQTSAHADARGAVRGRAGPAEPTDLRSGRALLRLVQDPSRPALHRGLRRARRADGLRRARATRCSPARSSIRPRAAPPTHVAERGKARRRASTSPPARRARMRALIDAIEAGAFGRRHRRPPHRHRRLGARAPRCWSTRSAAIGERSRCASCRTSTAPRSTKR